MKQKVTWFIPNNTNIYNTKRCNWTLNDMITYYIVELLIFLNNLGRKAKDMDERKGKQAFMDTLRGNRTL